MNNKFSLNKKRLPICLAGVFFISTFFLSQTIALPSKIDAERFATFKQEVRCIVCQNQNLADSTAPLANDLREKIYQMIVDQKSDEDIKAYLVKRYGEFILLRPQFNKLTYFLWFFPFLGIICISWIFYRLNFNATS